MMENRNAGEGFLTDPLKELGKHLVLEGEAAYYFNLLQANVNEMKTMVDAFTEQANEGCMLVQDSRIVWVNQAVSRITGYKMEELIGRPLSDLSMPAMRDKLGARVRMLLAGDTVPLPEEWPILKGDRTVIYINLFAYRVSFMGSHALLSFFFDVTEQKKIAEERRMRSEMMDSINDGVFLMDLNGQIVFANAAFCEMAGYNKDQIAGVNVQELVAPELRQRFDIRMKQFSTHREARFTTTAQNREGQRMAVEVRGKIIVFNGKQRLLGVARSVRTDKEPDIETLKFPA